MSTHRVANQLVFSKSIVGKLFMTDFTVKVNCEDFVLEMVNFAYMASCKMET